MVSENESLDYRLERRNGTTGTVAKARGGYQTKQWVALADQTTIIYACPLHTLWLFVFLIFTSHCVVVCECRLDVFRVCFYHTSRRHITEIVDFNINVLAVARRKIVRFELRVSISSRFHRPIEKLTFCFLHPLLLRKYLAVNESSSARM